LKYALALAGGGTKGSYQIGVWKALREMDIEITTVAGTSIGAINGAAIALNEYEKTKRLWVNLDYSYMVDYKPIDWEDGFQANYQSIKEQIKGIAKKRGLNITPLRNLLNEMIDEDKIRKSDIELIITTVALSELKPVNKSIKDIPEGQVVDYIIASAALPVFQRIEIDGKAYLDGGAYDNLPINTLIERGHKNIIAVDLKGGLGIKQKVKENSAEIIYIANSSMLGGLLEFNAKQSRINMRLGYLDALKAFGKNYGKTYFIKDSSRPKYTYPLTHDEMAYIFGHLSNEKPENERAKLLQKIVFKNLRRYTDKHLNPANAVIAAAEIAAETFEIDRVREYSSEALVKKIIKTHRSIMRGFIPENHRIDRLKKRLMKYMVQGDEFPSTVMLLTAPKIFIANLFIYLMKQRMGQI